MLDTNEMVHIEKIRSKKTILSKLRKLCFADISPMKIKCTYL